MKKQENNLFVIATIVLGILLLTLVVYSVYTTDEKVNLGDFEMSKDALMNSFDATGTDAIQVCNIKENKCIIVSKTKLD